MKWTLCKDRMPDMVKAGDEEDGYWMESGFLLVAVNMGKTIMTCTGEYTEDDAVGGMWMIGTPYGAYYEPLHEEDEVIAWAPLPKYEEEEA